MIYRELAVPDPLQGVFLCAWQFGLEPIDPPFVQHSIPPDGTCNLSVARAPDGSFYRRLIGPSLVSALVPAVRGFAYCGLRLRPEAAVAVLGAVPQPGFVELSDGSGALAPLWSDLAALAGDKPDWTGTLGLLAGVSGGDSAIAVAVDRMIASGGRCAIAELAAQVGLSERQFRRRFVAATGIGAKQYADVQRARRALILSLEDADWAGVAAEAGFADQPHLARDWKERFGTPPARVGGYFGGMRHELLAPAHVRNLQDAPAEAA